MKDPSSGCIYVRSRCVARVPTGRRHAATRPQRVVGVGVCTTTTISIPAGLLLGCAARWGHGTGDPPCWTSTQTRSYSGRRRASGHSGPITSATRSGHLLLCASLVNGGCLERVRTTWQNHKTRTRDRKGETKQATDEGFSVVVKFCYDFPLRSQLAPLAPSYNMSIYISTC